MLCLTVYAHAISYVNFQNNTRYSLSISNTASANLNGDWSEDFSGTFDPWRLQTRLYEVNRNTGITNGEEHYIDTDITILGETVTLKLRLTGTAFSSTMYQSASGPGFNQPWFSDRNFHFENFNAGGKTFQIKYRADLPPGNVWDDIYYVIQEINPYPIIKKDKKDKDIINVLAYNVFMLTPPIGSSDETARANIVFDYVKEHDVIILSEAFYNDARENHLLPRLALEYPYKTDVVDESGSIEDGGVLIVSRWPIEIDSHIVFNDCDGTDCLSAKGAKYARINKLGVKYHIFGTHTQAFKDPSGIAARQSQLTQMRNWIDSWNIPSNERVLIGGDLNVDKIQNLGGEYTDMLNRLNVEEPNYIGENFTFKPSINGYASGDEEFLDYVMVDKSHLCPLISTNETQIIRHVEGVDNLWDNNDLELDLSDHFAVHGRFVYLRIDENPVSQTLCTGEELELSVATNINLSYQWQKNGSNIAGATNTTYTIPNVVMSDAGDYRCIITSTCGDTTSTTATITINQTPNTITATSTAPGNNLINATNSIGTTQWFLMGDTNVVANGTTHTTCVNGNYFALETSPQGCVSDTSNIVMHEPTPPIPSITNSGETLTSSAATGNQWYLDGNPISGATASTYTTCDNGNYYTIVTQNNCSSLQSNTIRHEPTPTNVFIYQAGVNLTTNANGNIVWYNADDDTPIGVTGSTHSPSSSGNFYIIATLGTCSKQSNTFQFFDANFYVDSTVLHVDNGGLFYIDGGNVTSRTKEPNAPVFIMGKGTNEGNFINNNGEYQITGNWENDSNYVDSGDAVFVSSITQEIRTNNPAHGGFRGNKNNFNNLILDKETSSFLILKTDIDVKSTGTLMFAKGGVIKADSFEVYVKNPASNSVTGATVPAENNTSVDKYVMGYMRRAVLPGQEYLFPTGKTLGNYSPVTIRFNGATAPHNLRVRFTSFARGYNQNVDCPGDGIRYFYDCKNEAGWRIKDFDANLDSIDVTYDANYTISLYPSLVANTCAGSIYESIVKDRVIPDCPTPHIGATIYNTFSEFAIMAARTILPVELVSLNASAEDNTHINVEWITATEINNMGFEVQRSTDGVNFDVIGWVDGNGTTNEETSYIYKDEDVEPGITYYYRLRQVDFDLEEEYTGIVNASLVGSDLGRIFEIYPNPVVGDQPLFVNIGTPTQEKFILTIVNDLGQVVRRELIQQVGNSIYNYDMSELSSGNYFINLKSQEQNYNESLQFIVVK